RFVATPRVSRHVSWRWISASLLLTSLACGFMRLGAAGPPWWQRHWLTLYAAVAAASAVAVLAAGYPATEAVSPFSTDGAAKLLECTGGLGTLRRLRCFMTKVAAHVQLASAARRSTQAEHLRDEMREHARLKEIGLLCEQEYELAKARILGKHSPV